MAVEAVVSVALQKFVDILKEEPPTHGVKAIESQLDEIRKALEEAGRRGFLTDAEDKQETGPTPNEHLTIVYSLEDVIETFGIRIARQKKRLGFLMNYYGCLCLINWTACRKLHRKMARFHTKINNMLNDELSPNGVENGSLNETSQQTNQKQEEEEEERDEVKALPSSNSTLRLLSITRPFRDRLKHPKLMFNYSFEEELCLVGEDVDTWVKRLTEEKGDLVVSIVGVMGSGKTTLARAIYGRRAIKYYFECRAWVFVSKEYTIMDLLLSLLKQIGNLMMDQNAPIPDEEEELGKIVLDHLKEKRYLIVLDDVPTNDVWEKLKNFFADTRNGSKIIFTTSEAGVATHASPESSIYALKQLSHSDSWDMFLKKAGLEETSPSNPDYKLKQDILEICNGLTLNIVLLSGLLSTKERRNPDEWQRFLTSQFMNRQTSDILCLSYKDLPFHPKLCLLYLVLFPKEFDIPVRRLLRLWLAEGFVKPSDRDDQFPEDVVQGYFEDLVNRSMIQISKSRSDGSPRRCRLLGALHDYLSPKAQYINLFYVHRNSHEYAGPIGGGIRRMVEYVDIKNFCSKFSDHQFSDHQFRLLRSYISFNFPKRDTPAKGVGRFLGQIIANGFGLLRVLDLEGVYKPTLPEKLGDLYNLRYLGLRWTFLDTLPPSVCDLSYLETLDMKHTYINSLPTSIWKLKHLRHLNLNEIRLDMPMQQTRVSEMTLLTLWGLFVNHKSPVKNGLDRLKHLRELGISFDLNSSQKDLFKWIAGLTPLQTLRLRSKDDIGRPSKLILEPLSTLEKLSNLNLFGNIQRLPDQHDFPPNVKVLTLSVSNLKDDPMPTLGQLPSLTVLRLLANSYLGMNMRCHRGAFGKLRVLKLWMLKELEEWDVEEGVMENLKELNIRCCHKLKNIPLRLLELEKMEELILTNMPQEFTDKVKQKWSKHKSLTVHTDWKFTPLPWEEENTIYFK